MKQLFYTFLIGLFIVFGISSCTEDGEVGECYISFEWEYQHYNYTITGYTDNNNATPDTIFQKTDYKSNTGTYSFTYWSRDNNFYYVNSGSYTLEVEEGNPASFFTDGDDGLDRMYVLYMFVGYGGSDDYVFSYDTDKKSSVLFPPNSEVANLDFSNSEVEYVTRVFTNGKYKLTVKMEIRKIAK